MEPVGSGSPARARHVVVSVSLSRYYRDARALSYMRVARRRRAGWLAARLARRWGLPAPRGLALSLRGHLLPPAERLHLLAPGDTLLVIPRGEDWFPDEDDLTSSSEDEAPLQKRQTPPKPMWPDNEHEVKNQPQPQNETLDDIMIENQSMTSSVVTQSDAPDELRALKRRALALLDCCAPPEPARSPSPAPCPADMPDGADAGAIAARQRRRRVRRRTRRLPPDADSPPPPPPPPRPAELGTDVAEDAAPPPPPPPPGAVLRNGAQRGDTRPRLVRPLH